MHRCACVCVHHDRFAFDRSVLEQCCRATQEQFILRYLMRVQLGETPAVNRGFFETSMNNMTERQFQSNYRMSRHPRSARLRCGVTVSHDGRVTVTVV